MFSSEFSSIILTASDGIDEEWDPCWHCGSETIILAGVLLIGRRYSGMSFQRFAFHRLQCFQSEHTIRILFGEIHIMLLFSNVFRNRSSFRDNKINLWPWSSSLDKCIVREAYSVDDNWHTLNNTLNQSKILWHASSEPRGWRKMF